MENKAMHPKCSMKCLSTSTNDANATIMLSNGLDKFEQNLSQIQEALRNINQTLARLVVKSLSTFTSTPLISTDLSPRLRQIVLLQAVAREFLVRRRLASALRCTKSLNKWNLSIQASDIGITTHVPTTKSILQQPIQDQPLPQILPKMVISSSTPPFNCVFPIHLVDATSDLAKKSPSILQHFLDTYELADAWLPSKLLTSYFQQDVWLDGWPPPMNLPKFLTTHHDLKILYGFLTWIYFILHHYGFREASQWGVCGSQCYHFQF